MYKRQALAATVFSGDEIIVTFDETDCANNVLALNKNSTKKMYLYLWHITQILKIISIYITDKY